MFRFRPKRPRVIVTGFEDVGNFGNFGKRYTITPESYAGPWGLEPGTVLEIVSTPKREKPR